MDHTLRSKDGIHSEQSLAHSVLRLLGSWLFLSLGLFKQAPEETGNSSRLASPGTSLFLDSPVLPHDLCTCPRQQLGWKRGGYPAQLLWP